MNPDNVYVTPEHKALVKMFVLSNNAQYRTKNSSASVTISKDDSRLDGSVRVGIPDEWVFEEDALELAAFFKRLAKTLHKRHRNSNS